MGFFEQTIKALNEAGIPSVVTGDLAVVDSTTARVLALEQLIEKKRDANGGLDLVDAEYLEDIKGELEGSSCEPRDGWEEHHQEQMRHILLAGPTERLAAFEELIIFASGVVERRAREVDVHQRERS